jgi:AcrR family transcriptional regulator
MPHRPNQKADTRARILRSARHLFNRRGFAGVTIDEIMAHAGLTRGGFYKHFSTKEQLYAEAIANFVGQDAEIWRREAWQRAHVDATARGPQLTKMIVNAYLSQDHFDDQDGSCPMIGLSSEAARGAKAVKTAYRQVLEKNGTRLRSQPAPGQVVREAAGSGAGGPLRRRHGSGARDR